MTVCAVGERVPDVVVSWARVAPVASRDREALEWVMSWYEATTAESISLCRALLDEPSLTAFDDVLRTHGLARLARADSMKPTQTNHREAIAELEWLREFLTNVNERAIRLGIPIKKRQAPPSENTPHTADPQPEPGFAGQPAGASTYEPLGTQTHPGAGRTNAPASRPASETHADGVSEGASATAPEDAPTTVSERAPERAPGRVPDGVSPALNATNSWRQRVAERNSQREQAEKADIREKQSRRARRQVHERRRVRPPLEPASKEISEKTAASANVALRSTASRAALRAAPKVAQTARINANHKTNHRTNHKTNHKTNHNRKTAAQQPEAWCICRGPSAGLMLACDNVKCPYEWFHASCVGLTRIPTTKWFCPMCQPRSRQPRARA